MKNNSRHWYLWVFIAILLCGFALYIPSLHSRTFYFDDYFSIQNNEVIKKIDIPRIFNAFNTRSLVGLSFALNYRWCGLHAAGYRLINLLIHGFNAFLVYWLIKSTLYLYAARKSVFFCPVEWPAFFASMLFLCHPIQTEPVNFITQRFVLMGSFFYLLTLVLFIQYRYQKQKRYLFASMTAASAAMLCKEFVVTLPLMLLVYDFYFLDAGDGAWWQRCRRLLPFFIIALIVPLLLLRTPREAIGTADIADSHFVQASHMPVVRNNIDLTRAHGGIGRKQYFLTEVNVMCTYVRLLFLPINQNFDYDYPIAYQVDKKTALCGAFLFCLLALAGVTYSSYRIVSFGILWFFIALSVESSFIPIGHVIAEYRLYLASVGFVFLVMALIYMRQADVKKCHMIAALILMGFSIVTYQRNKVWENEITLWTDAIEKSPHKASAYNNRGFVYFEGGNLAQAIADSTKAIAIDPHYAGAYNSRGFMYDQQGHLTMALADYNKAIDIDPNYAEAYNNRGNTYFRLNNFSQALADYTKAIEINPNLAQAYNNRGLIYKKQNNFTQAIADYTKAIEINPDYADAYNNRGNAYWQQNNLPQAMVDYTKAIEINPGHVQAHINLKNAYSQLRQVRP